MCLQLNASELSAIMMKGSQQSNDRDAGFCSGGSEGGDDLSMDHHSRLDPSSPTDTSEDSVEVKVTPITLIRNKRKSTEPSKVICDREETGPLKKRIRYSLNAAAAAAASYEPPTTPNNTHNHLRTSWDPSQQLPHERMPNPAEVLIRHPGVTTLHRLPIQRTDDDVQDEPLALVLKKPSSTATTTSEEGDCHAHDELFQQKERHSHNITPSVGSSSESVSGGSFNLHDGRPQQRNYKNMTRERRIEANARERTRVHTISAAYETLRKAVPSYSNSQKLSKLSVLRVACSYILTLSRMAGEDYSEDQSAPSIASCMEAVTATIQTEGKIRKKKDE